MATPRLGLNLPIGSDVCDVKAAIDPQLAKIDSVFDAVECTSVTHPAPPFDGMLIWETDTNLLRTWYAAGPTWVTIAQYNRPYGKKGIVTSAAAGPPVAKNTEVLCQSITFSTKKGRRYAIRYTNNLEITSADSNVGDNKINMRMVAGAVVTTADPVVWWAWADMPTTQNIDFNQKGTFTYAETAVNPPIQYTVGLCIARGNSNGTIRLAANSLNTFLVEDIGAV